MTAKVVRIPEFPEPASTDADPSPESAVTTQGWDPYEVWRTRVLLPRLEEGNPPAETRPERHRRFPLVRLRRHRKA